MSVMLYSLLVNVAHEDATNRILHMLVSQHDEGVCECVVFQPA